MNHSKTLIEHLRSAEGVGRWTTSMHSAADEIESLRQQLAAMTKERDKAKAMPMKYRRMAFNAELQDEIESLRQQLADSQKREGMLRHLLSCYQNEAPVGNQPHMICHLVDEALAATEPK